MNDSPPSWMDQAPPHENSYAPAASKGGKKPYQGTNNSRPAMTAAEQAAAAEDFYDWLLHKDTAQQLKMMLPDHVDPDIFIATCKTAVLIKPQLLRQDLRPSLMVAVLKAAAQGLKPDGKEGALVPRYDTEANGYAVVWQPMVWGICKLGRETGAIRQIRAVIVYHGESFRILAGEEDRIEHEVDPDIVEEAYGALNAGLDAHKNPKANPGEYMKRVRAAYCYITGADGTVTRRWMTRQRLISLWEASKAANGPWNSRWVDEMILKGLIIYTSKWINLDTASAPAKRFQSALMTDMEVEFDHRGQIAEAVDDVPVKQALLAAPTDKLGTLEDAIMNGLTGKALGREKVAVDSTPKAAEPARKEAPKPAAEKKAAKPSEQSFLTDAATRLMVDGGMGHRWLKVLEKITLACPSITELSDLGRLDVIQRARKDAPPQARTDIAALFTKAALRLGEGSDVGWETGEAA